VRRRFRASNYQVSRPVLQQRCTPAHACSCISSVL
jgi:hypothetical protein